MPRAQTLARWLPLIVLYFVHLRRPAGVTRLAVLGGVLWLGILLVGLMDDYLTRAWLPPPGP